jgi:hypothetical protein
MVKTQSQQSEEVGYSVANEEIGEELLLRCWNETIKPVHEAIKINKESGARYPELYIDYFDQAEPMDVHQKKRWLAACKNKKTGEFHTLDQLKAAGKISDVEKKLFGDKQFPRREISQIVRHQDYDKREWLFRFEQWIGLTTEGGVVTVSANNIDFAKRVGIRTDTVPQDPAVKESPHVKVLVIGTCLPAYETAEKIYLTPFTKENVLAALQKAERPSDSRLFGRLSFILSKDDTHNPITSPDLDLDTFVTADFDSLWKQLITPGPQINISGKDFANYVKLDREARDEHKQYT